MLDTTVSGAVSSLPASADMGGEGDVTCEQVPTHESNSARLASSLIRLPSEARYTSMADDEGYGMSTMVEGVMMNRDVTLPVRITPSSLGAQPDSFLYLRTPCCRGHTVKSHRSPMLQEPTSEGKSIWTQLYCTQSNIHGQ